MRTRRQRANRLRADPRRLDMQRSNILQSVLPVEVEKRRTAGSAWVHCCMDAIEAVLSPRHLRKVSFRLEEWRYTTQMRPRPTRLLRLAVPVLLALTSTTLL